MIVAILADRGQVALGAVIVFDRILGYFSGHPSFAYSRKFLNPLSLRTRANAAEMKVEKLEDAEAKRETAMSVARTIISNGGSFGLTPAQKRIILEALEKV